MKNTDNAYEKRFSPFSNEKVFHISPDPYTILGTVSFSHIEHFLQTKILALILLVISLFSTLVVRVLTFLMNPSLVTGTPHGWDVLFYTFQFFRAVLFFTVIILIGTGWSFLKPFLQEKEKKMLMIVIPLQVLANIASIVIGENGPFIKSWITWNQIFLLVDVICCCAIIFPIVWSIQSLRETSKTDGKAARNLAKLTLFRQFYVLVIGYLYFTRIIVFCLKTIVSYNFQWVSNGAEEVASIVFYMVMFHMFRPIDNNEYFLVDDYEEMQAEKYLQEEELEL